LSTIEVPVWRAINLALDEEMDRDDRVVLFGEDIAKPGGVQGVTRNLWKKYGAQRVWDTPISEEALVGAAIGAAMTGLRPVLELMYMDFSLVAADQLINHAARIRYLSRGQYSVPMTVRIQQGFVPAASPQHSQCLESIYAHAPGLRIVAPYNAQESYDLLKSAIRSDDPVLYLEFRGSYTLRESLDINSAPASLDRASIVRQGRDITLVAWSRAVYWSLEAAERLAAAGIEAEVISLRCLTPIDYPTVFESVGRTRNLAIVQEPPVRVSLASEIAARTYESIGDLLNTPIRRYGSAFVPTPVAPVLASALRLEPAELAAAIAVSLDAKAPSRADSSAG
jgi:pyruvate dehydrogenase E1 component beta subunit